MFQADFYIDTIQNGKKQFVNTFVQHESIRQALNSFIDGQTAYTKAAAKVGTEVGTQIYDEATKVVTEMTKFDFGKYFKVPSKS